MRRYAFIAMVLCMLLQVAYADNTNVGTTGANYLKMGLGAKAASMGENFTALADDSTAAYWNPAGITGASGREFDFMQMNWFAGISTKVFSGIYPLNDREYLGGYWLTIDTPSDKETRFDTVGGYEETGDNFKSEISVFDIVYARRLSEKISVGAGLKSINENLAGDISNGYALDLGVQYKELLPNLDAGVAFQNMAITKLRKDENFPFNIALGINYHTSLWGRELNIMSDVKMPNDNDLRYGFGLEYWLVDGFAGRLGYNNLHKFSFGLGLKLTSISADYAYVPFEEEGLGVVHRFSVGYKFDALRKMKEELARQKAEEESVEEEIAEDVFSDIETTTKDILMEDDLFETEKEVTETLQEEILEEEIMTDDLFTQEEAAQSAEPQAAEDIEDAGVAPDVNPDEFDF